MPSRSFFLPKSFELHLAQLGNFYGFNHPSLRGLPADNTQLPLIDESSLPILIGISPKLVQWIVKKKEKNYRCFSIPREGKEPRLICSPRTYLKVIQWWILDNILSLRSFDDCVNGFIRGRSALTNARVHRNARHLLNMDIENFFPSISAGRILAVWAEYGYSPAVSQQLMQLTTFRGGLPQGAPTSPALANIAVEPIDAGLKQFALAHQLQYTRYADDLTFSSLQKISNDIALSAKVIVESHGLKINDKKTRFLGPGQRREVTGYVTGQQVRLPRTWRNRARAIFHLASRYPERFLDRIDLVRGYVGAICDYESEEFPGSDGRSALLSNGLKSLDTLMALSKSGQMRGGAGHAHRIQGDLYRAE